MQDSNEKGKRMIAIVVPVYNAQKYIKQCIKSIQKQTLKNYKLILVDDGSEDLSGIICDNLAQKDQRIIVIHQENKGSVEARKTGVLSKQAQEADYICFVDADDTLEKDALEILYNTAKKYNADQVCADTRKSWKSIKINSRYKAPCFDIEGEKVYNQKDIIEKLYISCFGITNFPVTLYAKLYKTRLITEAVDFKSIVKFTGDDLSVTLRCLPRTNKLVVIPNRIYNYRLGGGTSKFMAYMLEDFLALYRYKEKMSEQHPMPQDARYYMNIELMNIVFSWLTMCKKKGKYSEQEIYKEIERIYHIPEIYNAASELCKMENKNRIADMIKGCDCDQIYYEVMKSVKKDRKKDTIKGLISKL